MILNWIMNDVAKKETRKGFKRTPQRLAILEYLQGNTAHPSAEEIYRAVKGNVRGLSFATVYNTLNTLSETGSLRELSIDPSRKRYDPNVSPHHHVICVECKSVEDVPEPVSVAPPDAIVNNYSVMGYHIEFYGICLPCRKGLKTD
jgi:Fur family transcriptional regulator, peroxide stress response regulator